MKSRLFSTLFILSMLVLTSCDITEVTEVTEVQVIGNEVYSATIQLRNSDFVDADEFVSIAEFGWDNLDIPTVDEGVVLGYLQFNGETSWHSLPMNVPFENDLVTLRYNFDERIFNLILEGEVAGNNAMNVDLFNGDILRIVSIPPSQQIRGKGLDYTDYEAVAERYGLPK
ncbi:MAG: hypothetical protein AAFW89_07140 [Bacteroidota bacterium]